ncbi:MAG: alpha/beta hydrolase [Lachnospiraceae bacterium]
MIFDLTQLGSRVGIARFYKKDPCPDPLPIRENISYAYDELEEHKLDVIYPKKEKACYPFIMNIHGGAFAMHSKDMLYRNYGMRLAGDEFAVVNVNYRLAPEHVYPVQLEDILMAIAYVTRKAEQLHLDKKNMFLAGDSAGAYLAAMAACVLSNSFLRERYHFSEDIVCRAVAANSGMYDFSTLMEREISFPMKRKMVELLFGRIDFENSEQFPYSSVLLYITENFPPVYLMDIQGQSFEKEALRLEEVLKKCGVMYKLHIFEKREHLIHAFNIVSKYPQSEIVMNEIFEFFRTYVVSDGRGLSE